MEHSRMTRRIALKLEEIATEMCDYLDDHGIDEAELKRLNAACHNILKVAIHLRNPVGREPKVSDE